MKYWVTYPIVSHPPAADLMDRDGLVRFAETAEAAGFDGIGSPTTRPRPTSGCRPVVTMHSIRSPPPSWPAAPIGCC